MSKLDTLGPFSWLLQCFLNKDVDYTQLVVYRGVTVTDEMIKDYQQVVGLALFWSAFTSTSKDRETAEAFGNTLFIIRIDDLGNKSNTSSLSIYPDEQEVLLDARYQFLVEKIERDSISGKYLSYMGCD
ncbi:unnamed protein product [Adineta steineri]|uniref:ADP ribosyltransferase domain-containing protein n=1 Tax=Adineta steineri TaxID=433720 RepID=A0A819PHA2_9BILA|nr:unnamed protein product [Adineta steineri]CAF1428233.1 unnamed protein product [Adineta steineri]CAF1436702.1 unnamed protein product [Adineta steineri]CAF1620044.1 unnamed protein product [Adineta steineri]CAF4013440.1 unnamed protein product [Adineta steineri]